MIKRIIRKLSPAGVDWQSIAFFTLDLQQGTPPHPADHTPVPVNFHTINSPEDMWLAALCATQPEQQFQQRMRQGDQQCYIALLNGEPIAYAWVTTAPCHVSEINLLLPIGPQCIYIYDCFVRDENRGQGIYSLLLQKIVADYGSQQRHTGYDTAYIGAEPDNTASVRGIRRMGFEEFARIRYLRLWTFARWYGVMNLTKRMRVTGATELLSD